jgi:LmbE family N-acetylglucosaminyl deacetylase
MRIVCVTAHPDDETVFVGGTLRLLADAGAEIRLLCATHGEGGEAGEPPLCARAELGAVREAELRCAARALGCAGVEFLPFRDPDVGSDGALYGYASAPDSVIPPMEAFLRRLKPDLVITHGTNGEYGHPGHVLTNRACLPAAQAAGVPALYTFSASYPGHPRPRSANRDDPADFAVDVSGALHGKLAAMECHRSQHALFIRRPSAETGHAVTLREAVIRRESFRQAWGKGREESLLQLLGNSCQRLQPRSPVAAAIPHSGEERSRP